MASSFEFEAELRGAAGTGAVRSLRRENKVPAVLYGGGQEPVLLMLDHNKIIKKLENEAVYSHVLTIKLDGKEERAVLKDLQRHSSKTAILHLDFQRVSERDKIRVHVPLRFVGEDISVGIKKGGVVTHNIVDVEVSCLPADLPEYIEVDLAGVDVGESIHLSELKVPRGVEIVQSAHGLEHDLTVATVQGRMTEAEVEAGESTEAE